MRLLQVRIEIAIFFFFFTINLLPVAKKNPSEAEPYSEVFS